MYMCKCVQIGEDINSPNSISITQSSSELEVILKQGSTELCCFSKRHHECILANFIMDIDTCLPMTYFFKIQVIQEVGMIGWMDVILS